MTFISFQHHKHDFLKNYLSKLVEILVLCVYLMNSLYEYTIKIDMIVNQDKLFSTWFYYVTNYGPRDGRIKKIEGDLSLSVD